MGVLSRMRAHFARRSCQGGMGVKAQTNIQGMYKLHFLLFVGVAEPGFLIRPGGQKNNLPGFRFSEEGETASCVASEIGHVRSSAGDVRGGSKFADSGCISVPVFHEIQLKGQVLQDQNLVQRYLPVRFASVCLLPRRVVIYFCPPLPVLQSGNGSSIEVNASRRPLCYDWIKAKKKKKKSFALAIHLHCNI